MIEKLIRFFEHCLLMMQLAEPECDRKIYFNQAFGAAQFSLHIASKEEEKKIFELWEEWKEIFEIEVYR